MPKKVLIAGFTGAMGQKAVSLVNQLSNFELVAGFAPKAVNEPERYHLPKTAQIFNQLSQIPDHAADIWIDFTTPAAVYDNVYFALTHQIKPKCWANFSFSSSPKATNGKRHPPTINP